MIADESFLTQAVQEPVYHIFGRNTIFGSGVRSGIARSADRLPGHLHEYIPGNADERRRFPQAVEQFVPWVGGGCMRFFFLVAGRCTCAAGIRIFSRAEQIAVLRRIRVSVFALGGRVCGAARGPVDQRGGDESLEQPNRKRDEGEKQGKAQQIMQGPQDQREQTPADIPHDTDDIADQKPIG